MAMEIAARYAAVAALISGIVWYYGGFDRLLDKYFQKTPQTLRSEPAEKPSKKKKGRSKLVDLVQSGTESASSNEKKRKITSPSAATASAYSSERDNIVAVVKEDDGDMNTKEFARQFAKTQQGVSFVGKQDGAKSKIRTVKAKTVDVDSPNMSAENSSTGQDGDDETTPAGSPSFNAVTSAAAPDTSGVSDMLEPPKEGPKSIRLTGWEEPNTKKQKPASKAPEPVETKKQRQQRTKREEEKKMIEQSLREHQAKGQQQMRTARMAEGISKQTKANAFRPLTSVWTAAKTQDDENAVKQPPTSAAAAAPLDTFEPKALKDITNNTAAVTTRPVSVMMDDGSSSIAMNGLKNDVGSEKTSALAASDRERGTQPDDTLQRTRSTQSWADEVNEDENTWSQVTTKKEKKKGKKPDENTNGDSTTSTKQVNGQAPKTTTSTHANGSSSKLLALNRYKSLETGTTSNGLQDDEWEA
jgi:hypothetical protein